ncbi:MULTISPECIES: hypothetical protein [Sphingomonas]|uniref:Terminase small subunit n=1 Tax=Sphingomonas molluscorum TaxID=418184 RepID=A0ABU8Q2K3_9SPHN|nr:hypothetical protein [Sphingomonas sp. JUb134]MBM7405348.1 hypothetical protein [Sphingomonas sp. JUb134]
MARQIGTGSKAASGTGRTRSIGVGVQSAFLDHLAATGSVEAAAEAVAIAPLQAYAACRSDAGFAEGWRAALRVGYDRLEAMLIERTAAVLTGASNDPLETPDVLFALRLIERQREAEAPSGKRARAGAGAADKTDAAILKRLAMLSKRHAAEEARARRTQEGGDA